MKWQWGPRAHVRGGYSQFPSDFFRPDFADGWGIPPDFFSGFLKGKWMVERYDIDTDEVVEVSQEDWDRSTAVLDCQAILHWFLFGNKRSLADLEFMRQRLLDTRKELGDFNGPEPSEF